MEERRLLTIKRRRKKEKTRSREREREGKREGFDSLEK